MCPSFLLLILTNLDQDLVDAGFKLDGSDVLVDLHAGVIDFVGDNQFSIDPDLLSIDAPDSQFACDITGAVDFRKPVDNTALFIFINFRKIDQSLFIGTGLRDPLHITILSSVAIGNFAGDIVGLDGISRIEFITTDIIEWSYKLPLGKETKVLRLIDRHPELTEPFDDRSYLFRLPSRVEQ